MPNTIDEQYTFLVEFVFPALAFAANFLARHGLKLDTIDSGPDAVLAVAVAFLTLLIEGIQDPAARSRKLVYILYYAIVFGLVWYLDLYFVSEESSIYKKYQKLLSFRSWIVRGVSSVALIWGAHLFFVILTTF